MPAPRPNSMPRRDRRRGRSSPLCAEPRRAGLVPTPSPKPKSEKRFLYASVAGSSEEPPRPSVGLSASPPGQFPLYQDAEVVGAPEADDDHPDELSYVPFEVASLMTERSITYNRNLGALTAPEQKRHRLSVRGYGPSAGAELPSKFRLSGPSRRAELLRASREELLCRARRRPARPSSLPTPPARLSD